MTFNTFIFWLIFPCVFSIYWVLPGRLGGKFCNLRPRNWFLIFASYLLYANWKPAYTLILLAVTLLAFIGARYIEAKEEHRKRGIIFTFATLSLVPLLVFKYYNFVNESVWSLMSSVGMRYELHGLYWTIPVGISFYTFQALGYLFDVYYNRGW